jgi:hypothetical protein
MKRILVVAAPALSLPVAASVALRTRSSGPVGLIMLPCSGGNCSDNVVAPEADSQTSADSGFRSPSEGRLPLPTPGAARVAAELRRAGHRATARWRLVVCRPTSLDAVDDAAAIIEAACGTVTAVSGGLDEGVQGIPLRACDLVVGVGPSDAPTELFEAAEQSLSLHGSAVALLRLDEPGFSRSLPLAGICPPPEWTEHLDRLDAHLTGSDIA